MSELGLFSESPQQQSGVPPRRVLLEALAENLPSGREDVVLVRVWATAERGGEMRRAGYQIEDRHDGRFSALARTTAFPTTALADYILSGRGGTGGALTMDHAIPAEVMIEELDATDLEVADYVP